MSACIVESHGIRGKGESVEGLFMKCVEARSFRQCRSTVGAGLPAMQATRCISRTEVMPSQASQFLPLGCVAQVTSSLLEQRLGPLANLRLGQVLLARGQEPHMPEGVFQRPGTVTVKLILGF